MKESVLITGSKGELGKALTKELVKKYNVKGIDIVPDSGEQDYRQVDIRHFGDVYRALDGIDYVVHAAALHGIDLKSRSRLEFIETNVQSTANLLEAAKAYGVKKFIFMSSSSVYGKSSNNLSGKSWVLEEDSKLNPHDIYDLTKLLGEELCEHYSTAYQLPTVRLRLAKFYEGPNITEHHLDKLYKGTDIRDVVQAIRLSLEKPVKNDVFNIASSSPFKENDLKQLYQDPSKVIYKYYPEAKELLKDNEMPKSIKKIVKINKAIEVLGYYPKYTFENYLESTLNEKITI